MQIYYYIFRHIKVFSNEKAHSMVISCVCFVINSRIADGWHAHEYTVSLNHYAKCRIRFPLVFAVNIYGFCRL